MLIGPRRHALAGLLAALLMSIVTDLNAQQGPATAISVQGSEIGGVASGPSGPEAGVWVIAETADLPSRYTKIVVTDDRWRYLIRDLPQANYTVWVRGYGLIDLNKVWASTGTTLNLNAAPAPNAAAAAQYYPPIYWFSMLRVPKKNEFPLEKIKSQADWLNIIKSGPANPAMR